MMVATCPHCKENMTYPTHTTRLYEVPKERDIFVCANCAEFSVFDLTNPTNLRLPTPDEYPAIAGNHEVVQARSNILFRKAS